jgi:hypothetical protein
MTLKISITLLGLICSFLSLGQIDSADKRFAYEICYFKESKEKPQILVNEVTSNSSKLEPIVFGQIQDYEGQSLPNAIIYVDALKGKKKIGTQVGADGKFNLQLPPGTYRLTASSIGFSSVIIKRIKLRYGETRRLELQLGKAGEFRTTLIRSASKLNRRQIVRIEKKLREGKD